VGDLACSVADKTNPHAEHHARSAATYPIGSMAAYWFIERLAGFAV
jgi:hypothetical protein